MSRGLKRTGTIILFLLAGFLFLVTLKESCGQIQVSPGQTASPVSGEEVNATVSSEDVEKSKDKDKDAVDQDTKRLELVLSKPLIFFIWSPPEEERFVFDRDK